MRNLIWLNGDILPLDEARLGVEDRGFQFADGVYEVIRLYEGRPFTLREHLERLGRSAAGIHLPMPLHPETLGREIEKFLALTSPGEGMVYLQLTRGVSARNHLFPIDAEPTLLFYTRPLPPLPEPGEAPGATLMTVEDERWKRCWVKSIALLPNVLAKNHAADAGADEAVFTEDGFVSECSASNLFVVSDGVLLTHPVGPKVLPGITRALLLDLAGELNIAVQERPVSLEEALHGDEVFITSTTREIGWVRAWDGETLSNQCGPTTLRLHRALRRRVEAEIPVSV